MQYVRLCFCYVWLAGCFVLVVFVLVVAYLSSAKHSTRWQQCVCMAAHVPAPLRQSARCGRAAAGAAVFVLLSDCAAAAREDAVIHGIRH